MNNKNNNISQFDELFKKGLENHSVTAPSGVFEAVTAATNAGAVGAKAVIAKWVVGGLVAVSAAVGGYYALNGNDANEAVKNATLSAEETKTNLTEDKLATELIGTNTTSSEDNTTDPESGSTSVLEEPPNGIQIAKNQRGYQYTIKDTVQFKNTPLFYQNDGSMIDETEVIDKPQRSYSISIKGNICNGSIFNMSLNTAKSVNWFVNDEKLPSSTSTLSYQLLEKGEYRIVAYVDGIKVADTFIDMTAPNVVIDKQELGSDAATLTAKTSEIRTAEWMYNGKVQSSDRQFAFDKRLYKTVPYLVTTDKHGCKDTFKSVEKKVNPHFNFVQTVITPNGDGKNDDYEVDIIGYESFTMIISDVNGKRIFASNNPDLHWNGNNQTTQLPCKEGEYAVYISYKLKNSSKIEKKYGKVTLTK